MFTSAAVAIPAIAMAAKAATGFRRVKNAIMKCGAPIKSGLVSHNWGENYSVPHGT
jgi:hypothetical protein